MPDRSGDAPMGFVRARGIGSVGGGEGDKKDNGFRGVVGVACGGGAALPSGARTGAVLARAKRTEEEGPVFLC